MAYRSSMCYSYSYIIISTAQHDDLLLSSIDTFYFDGFAVPSFATLTFLILFFETWFFSSVFRFIGSNHFTFFNHLNRFDFFFQDKNSDGLMHFSATTPLSGPLAGCDDRPTAFDRQEINSLTTAPYLTCIRWKSLSMCAMVVFVGIDGRCCGSLRTKTVFVMFETANRMHFYLRNRKWKSSYRRRF